MSFPPILDLPWDERDVIGDGDILSMSVSKLVSGTLAAKTVTLKGADAIIETNNYAAGSAGWQVLGDGSAEFNNVTVRGTIDANSGTIGGLTVDGILTVTSYIQTGATPFKFGQDVGPSNEDGIYIDANNNWYDDGALTTDDLTATGGTIGSLNVDNTLTISASGGGFVSGGGVSLVPDVWPSATGFKFRDTDNTQDIISFLSVGAATVLRSHVLLEADGSIDIPVGSAGSPSIRLADDTDSGFYGAVGSMRISVAATERLRVDGTSTAGNTALFIYDVDNATLERVTVGAADSGGTNYKVLRIPN